MTGRIRLSDQPATIIRPVPRWSTEEETAIYMRCSRKTVRRYLAAGKLTGYRMGDRFLRIDLNEVDSMLQPIPASGRMA